MTPNKFLTSGSPLQIPLAAVQPPVSAPSDAVADGETSTAQQDPSSELADFSTAKLSSQQVTVLRAIASGKGILDAAREAGVGRSTAYRWYHDPNFQKCLSAWKLQTKDSGRNILLTLVERSARIVERALEKEDVRVALTLLTKLGVLAAKEGSFDMIQETPVGGDQDRPALGNVERPAPSKVEAAASNSVKAPAAALANPGPSSLKELRGKINDLETKFGDMLPGVRR